MWGAVLEGSWAHKSILPSSKRLSPTTVNFGRDSCSRLGNREGAYIDAELAPFRRSLGDVDRILSSESRSLVASVWISSLSALRLGVACLLSYVRATEAMAGDALPAGVAGMEARFARLACRISSPMAGGAAFLDGDDTLVVGAREWLSSSSIHHSAASWDGPAVRAIRGPVRRSAEASAQAGGNGPLKICSGSRSGLHAAIGDIGACEGSSPQLRIVKKKQRGEREIPARIPPGKDRKQTRNPG